MREELLLSNIRSNLIRLEETIIFALIERAQFGKNQNIYIKNAVSIPDYNDSFLKYLLHETEKIHASVRRYTAPDEHPFTNDLPKPYLTPMLYEWPIKKTDININEEVLNVYINKIIPEICKIEDDGNYGSSAVCDINALQSISKRIHYGKFVAESKYQEDPDGYKKLIINKDQEGIITKLTDENIEKKLLDRVELKASTYGQEPNAQNPVFKIAPILIKQIYKEFIIPLTKKVEYLYLLSRLD